MRDIRLRDPTYLDDHRFNDYLNVIGGRLAAARCPARARISNSSACATSINAFALPGGFIGVQRPADGIGNRIEVASVLRMKCARHATHIARLAGAQQQMQLPTMVAIAAALLLGRSRPELAGGAIAAAQGAAVSAQLSYSRDFEREADRVGFQTLAASGYDVRAMAVFFEKMQRYTRLLDDGSFPSYLRSHPVTTERIADEQNRAAGEPYRQHASSVESQLVRAKLRADAGDGRRRDAFRGCGRDGRHASEAAAR
jgi:predicted Zn-dependent protease